MTGAPFDLGSGFLVGGGPDWDALPMADFPKREYSLRDIRRAGEALKGDLGWSDETEEDVKEIFRAAYNWRDSHAYPLGKIRSELVGKVRPLKGLTAARLKRMRSIRRKLRTIAGNLTQIQDLGGCRAILPSIHAVQNLIAAYHSDDRHTLFAESDYIANPKPGGYRSHHLVLKFKGQREATIFDGRRIEVQVRTRLQHSWATAVEAVGTFRKEELKAGQGDAAWLRLFELMSAEFADAEKCALPPNMPSAAERRAEIIDLNQRLDALKHLENMRQAVRGADAIILNQQAMPLYLLIKYDNRDMHVEVKPYYRAIEGTASYDTAEQADDKERFNTVLVEFASIDALKAAFPNYFGDVQLFKKNLDHIVNGRAAREYTIPPALVEPPSEPGNRPHRRAASNEPNSARRARKSCVTALGCQEVCQFLR